MKKEILIQKWLDDELSNAELNEFKALPEYESYTKISEKAKLFEDTSYDVDFEFDKLNSIIKERRTEKVETPVKTIDWMQPLMRVAAIFIIALAVYYAPIYGETTIVKTLASNTESIELPDNSKIKLNTASAIKYKKSDWESAPKVSLVGEALFNIEKGSSISVVTWLGEMTVAGSKFKVIQRADYFEVVCYEGIVTLNYKDKEVTITTDKSFKIVDGETFEEKMNTSDLPTWAKG